MARQRVKPGWLTRKIMVEHLEIADSTFTKWDVKPVAKIGRNTYYMLRDVIENRLRNHRRQAGCCEECGYTKGAGSKANSKWIAFCPKCNHPIERGDLLSDQEFWDRTWESETG